MIVASSSIESINLTDLDRVSSKNLLRKFGFENDLVELSIFNLNGVLLFIDPNFRDFEIFPSSMTEDGYHRSININYEQVLRNYGFNSGVYRMVFSFQRNPFTTSFTYPFYVTSISPSRTEIKIQSNVLDTNPLISTGYTIQNEILSSLYVKDYNLVFEEGFTSLVLNIQIDNSPTSTGLFFKLYNPLPNSININSNVKLIEEIINPIEVKVDLGAPIIVDDSIPLRSPNFDIDFKNNASIPSSTATYDTILQQGASSASFDELNQVIYSSIPVDLEFDNPNTPSGYTFENFVHFSSAVTRLNVFKSKLELIETYEASSSILDTITGAAVGSSILTSEKAYWELQKTELIQQFDPYERFLYYESNSYAWPKTDSTRPYNNASPSSVAAISWLGYELEGYKGVYTGGQLALAKEYDEWNNHNLINTLPEHITSNPSNEKYLTFIEMIGHYFDTIWAYSDSITDVLQADSSLTSGISKDLVFNILTQTGIPAFDQFENASMFEYFLGGTRDGTFQYQSTDGSIMISASNAGSIPKGDITKEIWKRLYHNAPYLLKTKGTERGLKALIACYGIPESILHVKEYGGPVVDKTTYRTFSYVKESYMASPSASNTIITDTAIPSNFKTIQFRVLPNKTTTPYYDIAVFNPFIVNTTADSSSILLGISQSLDSSKLESGSYAHFFLRNVRQETGGPLSSTLPLVTSSLIPIFNDKPWNLTLIFNSGSSEGNNIELYAAQSTFEKDIFLVSCSISNSLFFSNFNTNNYSYIGNSLGSPFTLAGPFSGSIQEYRVWTEKLTTDTIRTQALSPFNYNGNTITSSYEALITRIPLGSDLKVPAVSTNFNQAPNPLFNVNTAASGANINTNRYTTIEEIHHLTTPDSVGSSMVSDKIRIDNGVVDNDWLSPIISVETSPQDRQPLDYSDLGVFFSPTFEINEDIIYTLGAFRLDDYIGDPTYYSSGSYPALDNLKKLYFRKIENRPNFYDYIRTIQFFDHTLFKIIEKFVPAKVNLKTGVVIEPHYLERAKIAGTKVILDQTNSEGFLLHYTPSSSISSTNEPQYEPYINVTNYIITGSESTATENVAQTNRISTFYNQYITTLPLNGSNVILSGSLTISLPTTGDKTRNMFDGDESTFSNFDTNGTPSFIEIIPPLTYKNRFFLNSIILTTKRITTGSILLYTNNGNTSSSIYEWEVSDEYDIIEGTSNGIKNIVIISSSNVTPNWDKIRINFKGYRSAFLTLNQRDAQIATLELNGQEITQFAPYEFNDSVLSNYTWQASRYKGTKLIGSEINEYNSGDTTYGHTPVIRNTTRTFYLANDVISLSKTSSVDDSTLHYIPDFSYILIDAAVTINDDGSTTIVNLNNIANNPSGRDKKRGFDREFQENIPIGSQIGIQILDPSVPKRINNSYNVFFNQGRLQQIMKYAIGTANARVQTGTNGFVYIYGDSPIGQEVAIVNKNIVSKFYTGSLSGGGKSVTATGSLISFFSELTDYRNETNERFFLSFTTTSLGISATNPYEIINTNNDTDGNYRTNNLAQLSTAEIISSSTSTGVNRATLDFSDKTRLNQSYQYSAGGFGPLEAIPSSFASGSYVVSYLNQDKPALLVNLNKENELPQGRGSTPIVIIPETLHPFVKDNIVYFMARAGYNLGTIAVPSTTDDSNLTLS